MAVIFNKTKKRLVDAEKRIAELENTVVRMEGVLARRFDSAQKTRADLRREWLNGEEKKQ